MAADVLTIVALAGGGAVAVKALGDAADGEQKPVTKPAPKASPKQLYLHAYQYPGATDKIFARRASANTTANVTRKRTDTRTATEGVGTSGSVDQKALEALEKKAKEEFDKLEKKAKKEAAKALNNQFGTELDGTENFEETIAALSAVGATAACAATGVGTPVAGLCGALGAIVGKYLGKEFKEWAEGAWDDIEDWGEEAWDDLKEWGSDLW